jgi:4-hydroxybutyryl-CoA dehydratase/vinylacetyl-CoA-Delta-isomerase
MPLRTPDEYVASLRDERRVYYRGERVSDVTTHPVIARAIDHAAIDFRMAEDPRYRDLAIVDGAHGQQSRYFATPKSGEDLLARSRLIEQATRLGGTLVVLVKEIGTDALFALGNVSSDIDARAGTSYAPRVRAFHDYCAENDLAVAVAQTDVKGDRSLGPSELASKGHPDAYVRIVKRLPDGIVVRGAKTHTSCTTNVNELIVLPTRAMSEADADYAVSFAIPVDTPGLTLVASPHGGAARDAFDHPISSRHKMMETLTIFNDVFVPNERVFLAGEWQGAGPLALAFVEFHRFTAISYKLPLVDALVGAALLLADLNGIERAGHVRDKLSWLVGYAETLRALVQASATRFRRHTTGTAVPDPLTVNIAKMHFATNYHAAVARLQDIAGGSIATAPSGADLEIPEIGEWVRRSMAGRVGSDAVERLRALNLASDLTASDFGGYQEVLAIHAEGSVEAQKLTILRQYDAESARAFARELAGIIH